MRRIAGLRRVSDEETEPNMVPIMNMFMVLIPFLLMSASFFHIKAINTSVPVHAEANIEASVKNPDIKVTVVMEIKKDRFHLSALSDQLDAKALQKLEATIVKPAITSKPLEALAVFLKDIKTQYPASDTMILIPDDAVVYDEIVWAMDCARNMEQHPLFPNVVLSGSLG